jgi:very-short-patch-repair endonuclease
VVSDFLRQHDGVVTLLQARAAGLSKHSVSRYVRSGRWRRCSKGVYFADDRPFTDASRVRAAVWSYGQLATASGLSAAWWYGLTQFAPRIVEVTVPRDSNGRVHEGSRLRRRDLADVDVEEVRGLRVTAFPLTVIEAAVRHRDGAKLLDRALQRDVDLRALWRAQLRNKGRYGSPAARRLLQGAADGTHSEAERLIVKILREAGITGWAANHPISGYRVDIAFPGPKVAIEVDGFAFHSDHEAFQNDRVRQNRIVLRGWQVLRFTWLDLTEYPERVLATIVSAIRA